MNLKSKWIYCPICHGKTRNKIFEMTNVECFPLYCPKCKTETVINIKNFEVTIIKEPDILMQSR
ncbi:cysteine-rich KTR domain-containing protein [Enterococcus sp. BWR-S5]|uniref:cysteine-rich KTR domain-containing protein n=1 Tax=Enterococcus sp. BWR-S5 TaxID=2787714 RepID=UPI001924BE14|nr:cysteine-rich KTR domain-containing protein [Enterococcus sp. BWR-S5]MBL1226378.1 cysteine-rich KTR domain-containing protein [Enterococcus sp. BWR-S5]